MLEDCVGVLYGDYVSASKLPQRVVRTTDSRVFGHVRPTGNGGDGRYLWVLKRVSAAADEPPTIMDSGTAASTDDAFSALYRAIIASGNSVA